MNKEDLVKYFEACLDGEEGRVKKLRGKTRREINEETYALRAFLRTVHPEGDRIVDEWVANS